MQTVSIDLQKNHVTITPKPASKLTLRSIPEAIRKAGFKPSDMLIRAHGNIVEKGEGKMFRFKNTETRYPISGVSELKTGSDIFLPAGVEFDEKTICLQFKEQISSEE